MKHPTITIGKSKDAGEVQLDVLRLVDTRLLIQANSGGGKSWLFRRIAEQTAGQVQTVILDPEGEFVTLREKHDFLIAGPGGEVPADPRSAGLLCRRLVELQTSAVVDLFELKLPERREFVKRFLETLLDLPKNLWHPVLVMIDEAHLFAPERSAGESVATEAVIGLMSQGRKRGFCGMLATQRLSKLHKDAEAEANNVFIGRTWLDIDQKRAGNLLGMAEAERKNLRDLDAGDFYCFGPALKCNGVSLLHVGPVQTTHPKPGERHKLTPPRPSDAVKKIAAELKDLPKQADEEAKNLAEAKKQIGELKRQLKATTKPVDEKELQRKVELAKQIYVAEKNQWYADKRQLERQLSQVGKTLQQIAALAGGTKIEAQNNCPVSPETPAAKQVAKEPVKKSVDYARKYAPPPEPKLEGGSDELGPAARKILLAFYWLRDETPTPSKVSFYSGYSMDSSTWDRSLGTLRKGLVNGWKISPAGIAEVEAWEEVPQKPRGPELREWLRKRLKPAPNKLLDALVDAWPNRLSSDELAEAAEYSTASSTWDRSIGTLRAIEAAEGFDRTGGIKASDVFFEGA